MTDMALTGRNVDVVFMDPPRQGSSQAFLDALVKLKPKKVVYISCNPETLARDMEYLSGKGYRMERGRGIDMFPFTVHLEMVCSLKRVK